MHGEISLVSQERTQFIDITGDVGRYVRESGVKEGICYLYVPHTTAGLTVNEGADPSVARDMITYLNKLVPYKGDYHHLEGNSDAHIKSTLVGSSVTLIISKGRLLLGTWQAVFFCEFDGPRNRRLHIKCCHC